MCNITQTVDPEHVTFGNVSCDAGTDTATYIYEVNRTAAWEHVMIVAELAIGHCRWDWWAHFNQIQGALGLEDLTPTELNYSGCMAIAGMST
jgi:hypothetical protein